MPLFVAQHQHSPETCPASAGSRLLSQISAAAAARHGVTIEAEALIDGEHRLLLVLDAADQQAVEAFLASLCYLQPYVHDRVPPLLAREFGKAYPGAISWAGMSLEADPQNGLFYGVETLARKIAAFKLTPACGERKRGGIATVWKKTDTTTEWATLIGPKDHRIWVGTDIPVPEIPGNNKTDTVVWRNAATGRELARSATVPAMTQGSAVQPGYGGSMFFPAANGTLIKMTPHRGR